MKTKSKKMESRERRHARIRAKVFGTAERPRLSVFKSNTRIVAQIIDDAKGATLAAVSDDTMKGTTKTERAEKAGATLADAAAKKGIAAVVFDRGGFMYTGRIKVFADAARKAGLQF